MRSGLFFPLFDALADPAAVARLAAEAEEAGSHGIRLGPMVTPLARRRPRSTACASCPAARRSEAGREPGEPYDVVVALPPGDDPAPYANAGATWRLVEFAEDAVSVDQVRTVIHDGPVT